MVFPYFDTICPNCGGNARTRRLYQLMTNSYLKKGDKVLDFSPSRGIYKRLKKRKDIDFFSSDFMGEFMSDYQFDIQNIAMPEDSFDLVVCYHVLEHVENDRKAMAELFRVLKKKGVALVQTPFKEGEVHEDTSKITPQDRLEAFGQEDHLRIYSVRGLQERLVGVGFQVEVLYFKKPMDDVYGFKEEEFVLLCSK